METTRITIKINRGGVEGNAGSAGTSAHYEGESLEVPALDIISADAPLSRRASNAQPVSSPAPGKTNTTPRSAQARFVDS